MSLTTNRYRIERDPKLREAPHHEIGRIRFALFQTLYADHFCNYSILNFCGVPRREVFLGTEGAMLRNPVRLQLFGTSSIGAALGLFITIAFQTPPALAACMPGGPCISIQPYTPHGMGSGGVNMGTALMLGQILGSILSDSNNNQQTDSAAFEKAQALNTDGVKFNDQGIKYFLAKDFRHAEEFLGRAVGRFGQALKIMPESKTARENLVTAHKNLLYSRVWLAYNAQNWNQSIDYSKQLLRYEPGSTEIKEAIAIYERRQAAQGSPDQRGAHVTPTEKSEQLRASNLDARPTSDAPTKAAPISISGKWVWQSKCEDGTEWKGEFSFESSSDGVLNGTSSGDDGGSSLSGKVSGNSVTFTRQYLFLSTIWTATVVANRMRGSEASRSHGKCAFQAKRA